MGVIAFFYLLRVGEYTTSQMRGLRRTKQFRAQDVSFFRDGVVLHPQTKAGTLETATGATLRLTNQKNGVWGSCVHHHTISNRELCPAQVLARRIHHIYENTGSDDDMLCTYFDHMGKGAVVNGDITQLVQVAAVDLDLPAQGFLVACVGLHLLRAGGVVVLALAGESQDMIKKIGWWSSDTFLMYVHKQIAHLTTGVAERMLQPVPFENVEGATT